MYSGQLVANLSPEETSKEQLGLLMAGVGLAEADFSQDEEFENSYSEKLAA